MGSTISSQLRSSSPSSLSAAINANNAISTMTTGISTLPPKLKKIFKDGEKRGFRDDTLGIYQIVINASMITELSSKMCKIDRKIKRLYMNWNFMSSESTVMLLNSLKQNKMHLISINFQHNELDDDCLKAIGEYIVDNDRIESIWIGNNNKITDEGVKTLSTFIMNSKSLLILGLREIVNITNASTPALMQMIESSEIEELNIMGTSIVPQTIFAAALAINKLKHKAKSISFYGMEINDDDVKRFCDGIRKYGCTYVKGLNFEINKISSVGASEIFNTLRVCGPSVTEIEFNMNDIDDQVMADLGEYLLHDGVIEKISLKRNRITDKGIEILSSYMAGNTTMKSLCFSYNPKILGNPIQYFEEIATMSAVTDIQLVGTGISTAHRNLIRDLLKIPAEERSIPVASNTKSAAKTS